VPTSRGAALERIEPFAPFADGLFAGFDENGVIAATPCPTASRPFSDAAPRMSLFSRSVPRGGCRNDPEARAHMRAMKVGVVELGLAGFRRAVPGATDVSDGEHNVRVCRVELLGAGSTDALGFLDALAFRSPLCVVSNIGGRGFSVL
jgi:hypothetical protein